MQSLIHYTDNNKLASEKEVFSSFAETITEVNPSISNKELGFIKRCMEDDNVTPEELEYGFLEAYKDPDRYGKVEWNHIWKHIKQKREITQNTKPKMQFA